LRADAFMREFSSIAVSFEGRSPQAFMAWRQKRIK